MKLTNITFMPPIDPIQSEKNLIWLDTNHVIWSLSPLTIIDLRNHQSHKFSQSINGYQLRGSAKAITYKQNTLIIVHNVIDCDGKRYYRHRLIELSASQIHRLSYPFYFINDQVEFCLGLELSIDNTEVIFSISVMDIDQYIVTVRTDQIEQLLIASEKFSSPIKWQLV